MNFNDYDYDDDEYDYDDENGMTQVDVNIEDFKVANKSYFVSGIVEIEWRELIVEIDYPLMTRKQTEYEIDDCLIDVTFSDENGEIVEPTTEMQIALDEYFDDERLKDILRTHLT